MADQTDDNAAPPKYRTALRDIDAIGDVASDRVAYLTAMVSDLAIMNAQQMLLLTQIRKHLLQAAPVDRDAFDAAWRPLEKLFLEHAEAVQRLAGEHGAGDSGAGDRSDG
ncbi:MAG: hypothetical protein AB7R90_19335 [Reyranellaceae bacterium]